MAALGVMTEDSARDDIVHSGLAPFLASITHKSLRELIEHLLCTGNNVRGRVKFNVPSRRCCCILSFSWQCLLCTQGTYFLLRNWGR